MLESHREVVRREAADAVWLSTQEDVIKSKELLGSLHKQLADVTDIITRFDDEIAKLENEGKQSAVGDLQKAKEYYLEENTKVKNWIKEIESRLDNCNDIVLALKNMVPDNQAGRNKMPEA